MEIIVLSKDPKVTARVSVIVVTNVFPNENLDVMLHSTEKFSFKYEAIIILSNFQQREDVERYLLDCIKSLPNLVKIKIVLMDFDRGVSYGKNLGTALAESPNLLFVDDDVKITEDVEPLLQYLESNVCQGVQPLILKLSNQEIVDSIGDFIKKDKWKILYVPYSRGIGKPITDLQRDLYVEETPSMRGAFMIVRKEALRAVDGFDNSFNFGYEEVDLGWRMIIAGYRLLFVPTVKVLHKGGRSTDPTKSDENAIRLHLVNYYVMHLKITNYNIWPYLLVQFYRKLLDYEIWKMRKMKVGFINTVKDILTINKLFAERVASALEHKRILTQKFRFRGKERLEEFAKGKRFIRKDSSSAPI
jgi:GT2 family glycosyltransferase